MHRLLFLLLFYCIFSLSMSAEEPLDILIIGGLIHDGTGGAGQQVAIGIKGDRIAFMGKAETAPASIKKIDAKGLIIAPGFIDVHTHAYDERPKQGRLALESYITQGITTVFSGNDGKGPTDFGAAEDDLIARGMAANMALFVGHGSVRRQVVGADDRPPTPDELFEMQTLVTKAMSSGALGLSSGLFYAPGSYADTHELVALAKTIAPFGGVYESHIRDESNYTVGLEGAIAEAIDIGERAGVPTHIAHIKALGVDVWGKSTAVIRQIEAAQSRGLRVTADQYPWLASGTRVSNALVPRWAMAGGYERMRQRLKNPDHLPQIKKEMAENLRRRGGATSILLTGGGQAWRGLTLEDYSKQLRQSPIDTAIAIVLAGDASIASFNMNPKDVQAFMSQPWVMSSSDGGSGHPRKYASFPKKYRDYVVHQKLLTTAEFIRKSTNLPAQTFGLKDRGILVVGAYADIFIFNPINFGPKATFENPNRKSVGVAYLFVNGAAVIDNHSIRSIDAGQVVKRASKK